MAEPFRPIGYWIKLVDGLLERDLDSALSAHRLDRRQWQVLNVLHAAPATQATIDETLAPFLIDGTDAARRAVTALTTRGWVAADQTGGLALTDEGRDGHAAAARAVSAARAGISAGITADEYATAVAVLQRLAANLERR